MAHEFDCRIFFWQAERSVNIFHKSIIKLNHLCKIIQILHSYLYIEWQLPFTKKLKSKIDIFFTFQYLRMLDNALKHIGGATLWKSRQKEVWQAMQCFSFFYSQSAIPTRVFPWLFKRQTGLKNTKMKPSLKEMLPEK